MNSRQLILILVAAVVLGVIGWVLFNRGARSWESQPISGNEKVVTFPLNDVAHITIKDAKSELNLVNKKDGWVVSERADYSANFEQVSRLLQKVWELKPVQNIQVGSSQFARLDLLEPGANKSSGTLLDLKGKDEKRITALLLGKQYMRKSAQKSRGPDSYPAGRYVMPEDGSKRVSLVSDALQDVTVAPERWLNRDFIKVEKPKTIALEGSTPEIHWKIVRETDSAAWKFADAKPGEEMDKTKSSGFVSSLSGMSFSDVLDPNAKPEDNGLDKPSTITVETFDGFTYALKIGKIKDDKYPVVPSVSATLASQRTAEPNEKAEDKKKLDDEFQKKQKTLEEKLAKEKKLEGRPYLIAKYAVEQFLKNRADLIKTEASPTPAIAPPGPPQRPVTLPKRPFPRPLVTPRVKP